MLASEGFCSPQCSIPMPIQQGERMQDLRYLCSWPLSAASVTISTMRSLALKTFSLEFWPSGQWLLFSSSAESFISCPGAHCLCFFFLLWVSFICLLLGMSVGTVRMTQDACLYQQQNLVLGTVMVPQEWASSLIVGGGTLRWNQWLSVIPC